MWFYRTKFSANYTARTSYNTTINTSRITTDIYYAIRNGGVSLEKQLQARDFDMGRFPHVCVCVCALCMLIQYVLLLAQQAFKCIYD